MNRECERLLIQNGFTKLYGDEQDFLFSRYVGNIEIKIRFKNEIMFLMGSKLIEGKMLQCNVYIDNYRSKEFSLVKKCIGDIVSSIQDYAKLKGHKNQVKEGFTIICNNCGEQITFKEPYKNKKENAIALGSWYGGEISMGCTCGNEVSE